MKRTQGMNWIRQEKRLAIYLRDGMACAYCGATVEDESTVLTLDHLRPYSTGGSNAAKNLVTACRRCNSSRGTRSWREFAVAVADYMNHGMTSKSIVNFIGKTVRRTLPMDEAKQLLARRNGE